METAELYASALHWVSVAEWPTANGHWASVPHSSDSVLLGAQACCLHLTYTHTFLGKHVMKAERCLLFTHGGLRLCRDRPWIRVSQFLYCRHSTKTFYKGLCRWLELCRVGCTDIFLLNASCVHDPGVAAWHCQMFHSEPSCFWIRTTALHSLLVRSRRYCAQFC